MSMMLAACAASASHSTPTPLAKAVGVVAARESRVIPIAVAGSAGYLWILGTYVCPTGTCSVLMRGNNDGKSFVRVSTPAPSVNELKFASCLDGHANSEESDVIYWTRSGGRTWWRARLSDSEPIAMASGRTYVLVRHGFEEGRG